MNRLFQYVLAAMLVLGVSAEAKTKAKAKAKPARKVASVSKAKAAKKAPVKAAKKKAGKHAQVATKTAMKTAHNSKSKVRFVPPTAKASPKAKKGSPKVAANSKPTPRVSKNMNSGYKQPVSKRSPASLKTKKDPRSLAKANEYMTARKNKRK